ncbi:MAG: ABC transporter ATP-binding protein [Clostridia bacterium]|nr:ABC transporter ATP-binding protein [Clostridia bacterium]
MAGIQIKELSKSFNLNDCKIPALQGITLDIEEASFLTIVGKSGCGKTTLLRILSGLDEQTDGDIAFLKGKQPITSPKIAMVFQEPRLMPWLTVRDNMALSLIKDKDRKKVNERIDYYLNLLDLSSFQHAYPNQISGGMAQRVALGRTLCYEPDIILMDEPLGALDIYNRKMLQDELIKVFNTCKKTIVFVTHDIDEAIYMGQKVVVMNGGRIMDAIDIRRHHHVEIDEDTTKQLKSRLMTSIIAKNPNDQ